MTTKTITLPVEIYSKLKAYCTLFEHYADEKTDHLLGILETGHSLEEASNMLWDSFTFDDWFQENWDDGLYDDFDENWDMPVPTVEELDNFLELLKTTYTLCPTWRQLKSTNKVKFSMSRLVNADLINPQYESVRIKSSISKRLIPC